MRAFARVYGLETVVLRYFNVFGPFQDPTSHYSGVLAIFCRRMLAGEQPTIYGDGEQSRDFTYIDNVVHANLLAAELRRRKFRPDDERGDGHRASRSMKPFVFFGIYRIQRRAGIREPRSGDIRDSLADITLASQLLGYSPIVEFREGLRRTVEWYPIWRIGLVLRLKIRDGFCLLSYVTRLTNKSSSDR